MATTERSPLDWRTALLLLTFPIYHFTNDLYNNHRTLLAWLPSGWATYFLAIVLPFGTILPALALGWLIQRRGGDRRAFGATLGVRDLLLGGLGFALGATMLYFQAWRGLPPEAQQLRHVASYFIWLLFPSIAESLIFIGVTYHVVALWGRRLWPWRGAGIVAALAAIILSALAFGAFHFSYAAPWNTWGLVRTMFFVWLGVASFYALTRSMFATLMFHTLMAMTGFLRNQLPAPGTDTHGLILAAIAVITVLVILGATSKSWRALPGRQPA